MHASLRINDSFNNFILGILKFWEIIGVSILLGPLVLAGVGLSFCFIRTGIRDFVWGQVPDSLIIDGNEDDPEFRKYFEELENIMRSRAIRKIMNFFLRIIISIVLVFLFIVFGIASIFFPY